MTERGGTPTRADMLHDFTDMNRHAGTGVCTCPEAWPECKGTNKRPPDEGGAFRSSTSAPTVRTGSGFSKSLSSCLTGL